MQGRSLKHIGGAILWRASWGLLVTAMVGTLACQGAVVWAAEDGAGGAPAGKPASGPKLATFEDLVSLFHTAGSPAAVLAIPDLILLSQSPLPEDAIERAYEDLVALGAKDLSAPPAPTGDALFDRYALEVDRRLDTAGSSDAAKVPDSVLASWEKDFGNDPRYWELRWFCAEGASNRAPVKVSPEDFDKPPHNPRMDYLLEAQRRGAVSANTMLLLYGDLRGEHKQQLDWADSNSMPIEVEHALMMKFEDEELAFLNDVIERWPDEGWAYYERAMYWFELGEEEQALADLAAAAAAPRLRAPEPWPCQYVVDAIRRGTYPGSIPVCGAICEAQIALALPNYIRMKEHLKEAFVCYNLDGHMERFEPWHQFGCHLATSAPELPIQGLVGVLLVGMASGYVEENAAQDLTAGQIGTLQRIRGADTEYKARAKGSSAPDIEELFVLSTAGLGRGVASYFLLEWQGELQKYDDLAPILADLSQVHYPQLTLPECMKKYEAMTKERAMQYRKEQAGSAAVDGE